MSDAEHELSAAFDAVGLPLCRTLRQMLADDPSHCTERRGCGFTQATRFLAAYANREHDPHDVADLGMFANLSTSGCEHLVAQLTGAGWAGGWRTLHLAPGAVVASLVPSPALDCLQRLASRLHEVRARVSLEESRLYAGLVASVLLRTPGAVQALRGMAEKPEIGSCSQAEEFFLEISHGRIRRGGQVNVFVDAGARPLLVEKIGLGESHSALSLEPLSINGVVVPPGSLFALRYAPDAGRIATLPGGAMLPVQHIEQARFLRLTTLAADPAWRRRAFKAQVDAQARAEFLSPCTTTLGDLRDFAVKQLAAAG